MPYDIHTPFGIKPGQVTEAEQLQSNTVARHRAQAMQGDAQAEQMRALRSALGGDERDPIGSDPFFADKSAPSGPSLADEQTRAAMSHQREMGQLEDLSNLAARNAARDDGLNATQRGDLNRGRHGLEMGQMDIQRKAQGELSGLVGGAEQPAAGNGPMSEDQLLRMAILGGMAGGKNMPDVGGILSKRSDNRRADQTHQVTMQELNMRMEEMKQRMAANRAKGYLEAGDPEGAAKAAADGGIPRPRVSSADVQSRPEIQAALSTAENEAKRIGGQNYFGENFTEENPLPEDSRLNSLIDMAAQALTKQGVQPAEARAYVIQHLRQKYGEDQGGLSIPYIRQVGQSAVAQHLGRMQ